MSVDTHTRPTSLSDTTNLALMAPVKDGILADGFEPISPVERLRSLLNAMQSSRRNAREAELRPNVFADIVGRHGIITHFRYALKDLGTASSPRWFLTLNVGFDGGWETYMRVIYRDIGPLLDALLVHCEGYRPSIDVDFDSYCRWVRAHELGGGTFYTAGAGTVTDLAYLAQVEATLRHEAIPEAADRAVAQLALPSTPQDLAQRKARVLAAPGAALPLHLRSLKGLYRLTAYWGGDDARILWRFAQLALSDLLQVSADPSLATNPDWQRVSRLMADELAWLRGAAPAAAAAPAQPRPWNPAALQAALVEPSTATHGALVLLQVRDGAAAARHLATWVDRCRAPSATEGQARALVALTPEGLRRVGVHPAWIERMPSEFREGMESRAGTLGDVRSNHPAHWRRPLRHRAGAAPDDRIDLSAVHVAVMLRLVDGATPGHALHPLLEQAVAELSAAGSGLAVLAVEPTRSRERGHFGFVDGISQPTVVAANPDPRQHQVGPGELLLGHPNGRGDTGWPAGSHGPLDEGSFMVVRKLRQRTDRIDAAMRRLHPGQAAQAEALQARMMGRLQDGTALVPTGPGGGNDFNFEAPSLAGAQCPFSSHIRRSHPRDGRAYTPRILRRGMSYGPSTAEAGPDADRGTLFTVFCASIAEQFETVQRWVAGGNSSGVGSAQDDPFLGVPRPGEPRVFRWVDGQGRPQRADLGDQAFVELQWGLYLFVPTLAVLGALGSYGAAPPASAAPRPRKPSRRDQWRGRLEDREASRQEWPRVRAQTGARQRAAGYGLLLGDARAVFDALADDGSRYSVHGFGQRMQATVGLNHLGMDPATGHGAVGGAVNPVIAGVSEAAAFQLAQAVTQQVLGGFRQAADAGSFAQRHPDGRLRVPVDLITLSENVVGLLARHWFGLPEHPPAATSTMVIGGHTPEGTHDGAPRCPGDLIGPSRMIFGAHPRAAVDAEGRHNGPPVLDAVRQRLQQGLLPNTGQLAAPILQALQPLQAQHGADLPERSIAGLLLGFAPTVHGNFLEVMKQWIESDSLWSVQQTLADLGPGAAPPPALRQALLDAMLARPVPPAVWRTPVSQGQPDASAEPVVLGLASAIDGLGEVAATDAAARTRQEALLFGGDYFAPPDSDRWGLHACPGSRMGVGVLMGMIDALLRAGSLQPTGSPVLLMLTPSA